MDTSGFAGFVIVQQSIRASSGVPALLIAKKKKHKVNKTITEIKLWTNDIGDEGAFALAESLMASLVMRFRPVGQFAPGDVPSSASHQWSDVVLWVLHMLMWVSCVIARRCRAVTSCARTLASVSAAENLDISAREPD